MHYWIHLRLFTDLKISRRLIVHDDSSLRPLHPVYEGSVSDVSAIHASFILRVEYNIYIIMFKHLHLCNGIFGRCPKVSYFAAPLI
jgi:hypothetical protein